MITLVDYGAGNVRSVINALERVGEAVTVARTLSDTFAGIAPSSAPMFILVQLAAVAVAYPLVRLFYPHPNPQPDTDAT